MKIQIASDLHLDYNERTWPRRQSFRAVPDRDILVLAGDIARGMMARTFLEQQLEVSLVVYVPTTSTMGAAPNVRTWTCAGPNWPSGRSATTWRRTRRCWRPWPATVRAAFARTRGGDLEDTR